MADVVRAHRDSFIARRGGPLSAAERRVLDAIAACRTAALGGHVERCDACGHLRIAYNSCRNRHCPKCQELARAEWLAEREKEVLPVEYFHVVFTVPHEIGDIALQNKKSLYDILFRASAETLCEIAADPKHLGAQIGFFSVLHTWGQNLEHHPHVHCLISGGGIAPDSSRWISCRPGFFLPVRVLGRLFRGKFLHYLRSAFGEGRLRFHGRLAQLDNLVAFESYLEHASHQDWVVYAKPPFGGPEHVLHYLARYTQSVAISNTRLVSMDGDRVTFRWKDYRHDGRKGTMSLRAVEFLRRFLLHLLPKGFMRVRHYGFLANRCRQKKLQRCRELIAATRPVPSPNLTIETTPREEPAWCPECKHGRMVCVLVFRYGEGAPDVSKLKREDSS